MDWLSTIPREPIPYGAGLLAFCFVYFIVYPIVVYYRDVKGV